MLTMDIAQVEAFRQGLLDIKGGDLSEWEFYEDIYVIGEIAANARVYDYYGHPLASNIYTGDFKLDDIDYGKIGTPSLIHSSDTILVLDIEDWLNTW